jgi:hypothetical protein
VERRCIPRSYTPSEVAAFPEPTPASKVSGIGTDQTTSLRTYATRIAVLAVIASWLRPATVEACAAAGSQVLAFDTPANGAVVIDLTCSGASCFDGEVPDELALRDTETDELISGAVIHVSDRIEDGGVIVLRPAATLTEGHSYELMWQPDLGTGVEPNPELSTFQALAAAHWTLDDIEVTATTHVSRRALETVSCEPGYYGDCEDGVIATEVAEYVALQLDLSNLRAIGFEGHQLLMSMATWPMGEDEPPLHDVVVHPHEYFDLSGSFEASAAAYCYRVRLTSTLDGSTVEHQDCVEDTFAELVASERVSDDELGVRLERCRTPPEGYEVAFCRAKRKYCSDSPEVFECDDVETTCEGIDTEPPSAPDAGDEPSDERVDEAPPSAQANDGCAAAGLPRDHSPSFAAFVLLLVALTACGRCARAARSR